MTPGIPLSTSTCRALTSRRSSGTWSLPVQRSLKLRLRGRLLTRWLPGSSARFITLPEVRSSRRPATIIELEAEVIKMEKKHPEQYKTPKKSEVQDKDGEIRPSKVESINKGRNRLVRGWARVATGDETCAWCLMLVSRGPVYHSAKKAGSKISSKALLKIDAAGKNSSKFVKECGTITATVRWSRSSRSPSGRAGMPGRLPRTCGSQPHLRQLSLEKENLTVFTRTGRIKVSLSLNTLTR